MKRIGLIMASALLLSATVVALEHDHSPPQNKNFVISEKYEISSVQFIAIAPVETFTLQTRITPLSEIVTPFGIGVLPAVQTFSQAADERSCKNLKPDKLPVLKWDIPLPDPNSFKITGNVSTGHSPG